MARVPYVDVNGLNMPRVLLNSKAGEKNGAVARSIRFEISLDPRLREMAILQVGYMTSCAYEYAHHIEIGFQFGVAEDDVRAIAEESAGRPTQLDPLAKAVLRAAREVTLTRAITDETWAVLKQHLNDEQLVDLVLTIAFYNSTVCIIESLKLDFEPDAACRRFLEEFPLPAR